MLRIAWPRHKHRDSHAVGDWGCAELAPACTHVRPPGSPCTRPRSEEEAARAYDRALWRLKPKEAHSYVNFKDEVPPEVRCTTAGGTALCAAA